MSIMNPKALVMLGLLICVLAAGLMVADVIGVGWGSALGMVGVGLLASAGVRPRTSTD